MLLVVLTWCLMERFPCARDRVREVSLCQGKGEEEEMMMDGWFHFGRRIKPKRVCVGCHVKRAVTIALSSRLVHVQSGHSQGRTL